MHQILAPGRNCWRVGHARRFAFLIDAAAYFAALKQAILNAKRTIFIVGWDIDSRTELTPGVKDEAPSGLRDLLTFAVKRRPQLKIYINLWDYTVLYTASREPMPIINLDWRTPSQIKFCLDDELPFGACHHQKIVVVDDAVAFCGGIDLTTCRWDTPEHPAKDPRRVTPSGTPYQPYHDVQAIVDGEAAGALGAIARYRWRAAKDVDLGPPQPVGDPWPQGIKPDLIGVDVGIARTLPEFEGRDEVREAERLYLDTIARAENLIYAENQYFTAMAIAGALAKRLAEPDGPEVVLVGPKEAKGWMEREVMDRGKAAFICALREADKHGRLRVFYPTGAEESEDWVMVHSKVMIIDNRLVRVGSTNLNNRSMGFDSECDLLVEARNDAHAAAIAAFRTRLVAQHLGLAPEQVAAKVEETGSLVAALDTLAGAGRHLAPMEFPDPSSDLVLPDSTTMLVDPERPLSAEDLFVLMNGDSRSRRRRRDWIRIGAVLLICIALVFVWRYTPLEQFADVDRVHGWLTAIRGSPVGPLILLGAFVLGAFVLFPVNILIAATGLAFGPWPGLPYSLAGVLISATLTFLIGRALGRKTLRRIAGSRVNRASRQLARHGILAVAALRMTPIAPFTVINMVAGASHVRFFDFLVGTLLGMAPGLLLLTAIGDRLEQVFRDPAPTHFAILGGLIVAWLGVAWGIQRFVRRQRRRRAA